MNKLIKIIKKYDDIFLFLYMMFGLSIYVVAVKLNVGDELWNFSNVYKFTNGYKLYEDLNVIITPLFYYMGKLLFFILGDNLISFRIYNILIFSTLFTTIYILLKKLKIEKISAFVYTLIMFLLLKKIVTAGANYNILAIIFVILGIILQLNKDSIRNNILDGIIIFLIFLAKQNVVVYYCMGLILMYILQIIIEKIKVKEVIKNLTIRLLTFLVLLSVFVVYLKINNQLYDFISYTVLGIGEFGTKNTIFKIESIVFIVIGFIGIVTNVLLIVIKNVDKEMKRINLILLPFEIMMMFLIIPIINKYHSIVAIIIVLIALTYNLHNLIVLEFINKNILRKFIRILIIAITVYIVCFNSYSFLKYMNSANINYDIQPYLYILIDDELNKKIRSYM